MSITTKKGDRGTTFLISGQEVGKDSARVELLGTIDEVSCHLGAARAHADDAELAELILQIQSELIEIAGAIADPRSIGSEASIVNFGERVRQYEERIVRSEQAIPPVTEFRLPGASQLEAALHQARAVARRCERCAVRLHRQESGLNENVLILFNRIADYLWLLARRAEVTAQ
jgi:cob(I)alamin adenosyltransferase